MNYKINMKNELLCIVFFFLYSYIEFLCFLLCEHLEMSVCNAITSNLIIKAFDMDTSGASNFKKIQTIICSLFIHYCLKCYWFIILSLLQRSKYCIQQFGQFSLWVMKTCVFSRKAKGVRDVCLKMLTVNDLHSQLRVNIILDKI